MCKSRQAWGQTWGRTAKGVALGILALVLAAAAVAQQYRLPLRLTAFAVNLGTGGEVEPLRRAGTVEVVVERWSTPEEAQRLVEALQSGGPDALLTALRSAPRAGYIRTPDTISWDLHYAAQEPLPDGGSRIALATDRPLRFWEVARNTRTVDYPFTVLEVRMGPDGKGEGRMSLLTKITTTRDKKSIILENYTTEPVRLQEVRVKE